MSGWLHEWIWWAREHPWQWQVNKRLPSVLWWSMFMAISLLSSPVSFSFSPFSRSDNRLLKSKHQASAMPSQCSKDCFNNNVKDASLSVTQQRPSVLCYPFSENELLLANKLSGSYSPFTHHSGGAFKGWVSHPASKCSCSKCKVYTGREGCCCWILKGKVLPPKWDFALWWDGGKEGCQGSDRLYTEQWQ